MIKRVNQDGTTINNGWSRFRGWKNRYNDIVGYGIQCKKETSLDIVKFLIENDFEISVYKFYHLCVSKNNFPCLEYGLMNIAYDQIDLCNIAVKEGNIGMLKYFHVNKIYGSTQWSQNTYICKNAVQHKRYECLKYAFENGAPIETSEDLFAIAIRNNDSDIARYLLKRGYKFTQESISTLVYSTNPDFDLLRYLHRRIKINMSDYFTDTIEPYYQNFNCFKNDLECNDLGDNYLRHSWLGMHKCYHWSLYGDYDYYSYKYDHWHDRYGGYGDYREFIPVPESQINYAKYYLYMNDTYKRRMFSSYSKKLNKKHRHSQINLNKEKKHSRKNRNKEKKEYVRKQKKYERNKNKFKKIRKNHKKKIALLY